MEQIYRSGKVGRNSNSLVVCDGISHVLVVVHGVFAKNKYENRDIIIVKRIQIFLYLEGGKSHGSCS